MLNLGCTVPAGQAARAGHLRGCADPLAQKKPCNQIIKRRQKILLSMITQRPTHSLCCMLQASRAR